MKISKFVTKTLIDLLEDKRVVVWYDAPDDFTDFANGFKAAKCKVVLAAGSSLAARKVADDVYMRMNVSGDMAESSANLLVYVPRARHVDLEKRAQDPFEVYAAVGEVFGVKESQTLHSLARQAAPELATLISRMAKNAEAHCINSAKVCTAMTTIPTPSRPQNANVSWTISNCEEAVSISRLYC